MHICKYIDIDIDIDMCLYVCMYVNLHVCICICMYVYLFIYICTDVHAHMYICIYVYIYVYIDTRTRDLCRGVLRLWERLSVKAQRETSLAELRESLGSATSAVSARLSTQAPARNVLGLHYTSPVRLSLQWSCDVYLFLHRLCQDPAPEELRKDRYPFSFGAMA